MAVYDEQRCMRKLEKHVKFVEEGSCEAMSVYGGKEILALARNNRIYARQIIERIVLGCFSTNWQTRISSVKIYQSVLDEFLCEDYCVKILADICSERCIDLNVFDSERVVRCGTPLYSQQEDDLPCSTLDKNSSKIDAKQILDEFFYSAAQNITESCVSNPDASSSSTVSLIEYLVSNYRFLLNAMVSPVWTERHSAALCLEAYTRVVYSKLDLASHTHHHSTTVLTELSCYCVAVLLLDKYGDYVSCNMVAPVRESVSQLLGVVVYVMSSCDIDKLFHIIIATLNNNRNFDYGWQIVHSCLVATKYILLACKKRHLSANSTLVELVYQFFVKSFGVEADSPTSPSNISSNASNDNGQMIMDDVLAETCTILMMIDDQTLNFISLPNTIIFIINNMEMLDESCSSLSKVIDLFIHLLNQMIDGPPDHQSNSNFLASNLQKIIQFLYTYALVASSDMEALVVRGSTKVVCYALKSGYSPPSAHNQNHDENRMLIEMFWGHVYYLIYVLLTSADINSCLQLFKESIEQCVAWADKSCLVQCGEDLILIVLNLIAHPTKAPIIHNEMVKVCPLVGAIFTNTYERLNCVGCADGPTTVYQENLIAHQRVACLEAVTLAVKSAIVECNTISKLDPLVNSLIRIVAAFRLKKNEANFATRSLVLSAFLYMIASPAFSSGSSSSSSNINNVSVIREQLLCSLCEGIGDKVRYIAECYLPLTGVQDVFFGTNFGDGRNALLHDINQQIAKVVDQLQRSHHHEPTTPLVELPAIINNSKTLRQACCSFYTLTNSQISKDSQIPTINKLAQLELSKYIYCSRIQLFLIMFFVSIKRCSQSPLLTAGMEFVSNSPSWYIIPLMEAVKYEDISSVYQSTCHSLITFIQNHQKNTSSSSLEKIFNNLTIYIANSCITYHPRCSPNNHRFSLEIVLESLDNRAITIDTNDGIFAIYYHHHWVNKDGGKDVSNDDEDIFPVANRMDCVVGAKEKTLQNSVQLTTRLFDEFGEVTLDCVKRAVFGVIEHWRDTESSDVNQLVNSLLLFEHLYVKLDQLISAESSDLLEAICGRFLCHTMTTVRTVSSLVVARILFKVHPIFAVHFVHTKILDSHNKSIGVGEVKGQEKKASHDNSGDGREMLLRKYGIAELVLYIVSEVDECKVNLLALSTVVHVVQNLMDPNPQIAYCYSIALSSLIKYIPLFVEQCANFLDDDHRPLTAKQHTQLATVKNILTDQLDFMRELSMPSSNKPLALPFNIANAVLRPYQLDGINWLLFLQKHNLNGALCDDMGLGKTLQTIITVAYTQRSSSNTNTTLIICPPILVEHWMDEFEKFLPNSWLRIEKFVDNKQLNKVCEQMSKAKLDVLVTSYSFVRSHIAHLKKHPYNYVVLDEAHVIKNRNSKFYLAIKNLRSKYRLILTGTPIQNNVTELWTLFDFLMPNFLGSHKIFAKYYARPILRGFNPKCAAEAFVQAQKLLDNLHKQILPFVLRRTKHTVLDDLPEKIVQTIYCVMSPLQQALYDVLPPFDDETGRNELNSQIENISLQDNQTPNTHVFKMIHYLRRVCNHPSLALDSFQMLDDVVLNEKIKSIIDQQNSLQDISNASKLVALMELLQECGIFRRDESKYGDEESAPELVASDTDLTGHRALIFSQTTTVLDIIENDLLKKHAPTVKYLRLDGSVRPAERYPITKQFNEDTDISLLLLTTSVGSLGLNLTGADMVIFYDNDWNPMKDLQAMDRAHRIGQTRTVNVYRLVVKDTIEEHILNLQNYKLKMVNTVINESNADLSKMKDSDITDVFGVVDATSSLKRSRSKLNHSDHTDFSNGDDYAKQYDLNKFCKNLK